MKKLLVLVLGCFFFGACATCKDCTKDMTSSAQKLQKKIEANQKCNLDSDCVAVYKGCCQCDGQAAVNQNFTEKFKDYKNETCANQVCTMQYCFNDIEVKCESGKCVGEAKKFGPIIAAQ
ncbi:putative small secreted protein [Elusimicrobium posterum]|uniref:hypothetical protein n=1 Tax=Elusimicrobium posterum TaxID=3116653 RepID=UPI003C78BED1